MVFKPPQSELCLEDMVSDCEDNSESLNEWENDFIADISQKIIEEPSCVFSTSQIKKIRDCYEKL